LIRRREAGVQTIVKRAAGLDVHKAQVTACVRVPKRGGGRAQEVAEFQTTVRGLLALRDWLKAHGVAQVAMEATGVYWKPVWAILEEELDCFATDILGASGRAMLDALVAGTTDPHVLAELAKGKLRVKIPALREALEGRFDSQHALIVGAMLSHLDFLDEQIDLLSDAIE